MRWGGGGGGNSCQLIGTATIEGPCATTYAGTGGRLGGRLLLVDHTAEDGSRHQDDVDENGLHVELRLGVRDLLVVRRGVDQSVHGGRPYTACDEV